MDKGRIEAFSDGVIAIIITIMVLELRPPEGTEVSSLRPLWPVFLSYGLSFVNLGIYWNNHHHLFQAVRRINGRVLWANLHLLFWLSLIPFATAWMGERRFAADPVAAYGVVLVFAAVAYFILVRAIIIGEPANAEVARAVGGDWKGLISIVIYLVALPLAVVAAWLACALYFAVAAVWIIPDRRFERRLRELAEGRRGD